MITNIIDKYSKEDELSVQIEAQFGDGTSIVDSDVSIFDHIYFEKLLLEKVRVYVRHKYSDEIRITIYSNSSYSDAEIESHDSNLYNSVCHCIEESLNLMKKQNKKYAKKINILEKENKALREENSSLIYRLNYIFEILKKFLRKLLQRGNDYT